MPVAPLSICNRLVLIRIRNNRRVLFGIGKLMNGVQVSHEPSAHESGLAVRGDGWLRSILPIWLLH